LDKISQYPTTNGLFELRQTIAHWLEKRFFLNHLDPHSQVLPVMGTREAIFSLVQAVIDHPQTELSEDETNQLSAQPLQKADEAPTIVMPNPFYQIYEGAAILAQATPYFMPCSIDNDFKGDYRAVPRDVWTRTQLLFVCSPNNPTGSVMTMDDWEHLLRLSDQYGFIIASDECYSELYFDSAPIGLLQACAALGRHDFKNCVVFHSLSKRSNLPGLRSGFVAGEANILQPYLQYCTYQGCEIFVKALYEQANIHALAGRYLSREVNGKNPGQGYVRIALVASVEESREAISRIRKLLGA